jgi:hypothetical protein
LDYSTFNDTANELMVYAFSSGESVHDPGPVTKGLLKDLGWKIGPVGTVAFDGDGKTDIVVWRPGDGYWYIIGSKDGVILTQWGTGSLNDIPISQSR